MKKESNPSPPVHAKKPSPPPPPPKRIITEKLNFFSKKQEIDYKYEFKRLLDTAEQALDIDFENRKVKSFVGLVIL